MLDGFLTGYGGAAWPGAFPPPAPVEPPVDEAAAVDDAMGAAAKRIVRSNKRPLREGFPSGGASGAGMLAGMPLDNPEAAWPTPTMPQVIPMPRPRPNDLGAAPGAAPGGESVPLPRPRPAGADAMAAGTPADVTSAPPGPGMLDKMSSVLARNPNMLMAMGAGMMGAPTFAQGMSRGLAAAIPASQQDVKQNLQAQGISETYRSLVGRGVPPQEALSAVYNPQVMKAVVEKYFETSKPTVIGKDQFGQDIFGVRTRAGMYAPPNAPTVQTPEEVHRLPRSVPVFVDPDGVVRRNPNYGK